ncbi:hypothetical protein G6016_15965 [Dietzia aerolata]|uniref:hypothetical protein n=1 Tax=Dietzia aerolata TaxID=595984 RepID=UPI0015FD952E|nr:hypothetical protein [Dietzia aerolata]MBB0970423.1 hypothetical protein [Dietzia aerolata]
MVAAAGAWVDDGVSVVLEDADVEDDADDDTEVVVTTSTTVGCSSDPHAVNVRIGRAKAVSTAANRERMELPHL